MSISGCDIPFSQSVRNLSFYLDETLSMDAHIKYLCRILFCHLCRTGKICSFLSTDAANKLALSLILSRLDYSNSLLAGIPDNKLNKLQCIQNHAAQLVLRKSRHASATALLRTLHWLPVKARIQCKIACLSFQCIYETWDWGKVKKEEHDAGVGGISSQKTAFWSMKIRYLQVSELYV